MQSTPIMWRNAKTVESEKGAKPMKVGYKLFPGQSLCGACNMLSITGTQDDERLSNWSLNKSCFGRDVDKKKSEDEAAYLHSSTGLINIGMIT